MFRWLAHDANASVSVLPVLSIHQPPLKQMKKEQVLQAFKLGKHFLLLLCLRKQLKYLSPAEAN